jgi:DNA polymerase III sliding clamp (beta) subunit (PCNA family)
MSNKILAENLFKSLKEVKRTKIHSLPVLNYALLDFSNGELHITTTDLEDTITVKCPCRLDEEFSTCVLMVHKVNDLYPNGRIKASYKYYPFLDYIKVMAEDNAVLEFTFNPDVQILAIKSGRSTTEFKCLDAMEFPTGCVA